MDTQLKKVKAKDLVPGMALREITQFSADYSYLDSATIEFLQRRFRGASAVVNAQGATKTVPIEALQPLNRLETIIDLPPAPGLSPLDADTAQTLQKRGMLEFLVSIPPQAAAPHTDKGAPAPVESAGKAHQARLDEARAFMDKVEMAADNREQSSRVIEDMFHQGRAGKYTSKPAQEAVEDILAQGLSSAMTAVAGLKGSDQTYAHCVDMAVIFQETYADILRYSSSRPTKAINRQHLLAGFMHDIGKSKVPRDILDSTKRFAPDGPEMRIMRKHAEYGAQILADLGMDGATINVAHYHHVKVDTSLPISYPAGDPREVLPITRLAAIVDVYQALIGKRSYKRNWVPAKAVEYLASLRGKEFDGRMLDNFLRVVGIYPVGSLVRLSTGELAFVVRIGSEVPERPVVVVVENARGELLRHHDLIDLMMAPDLSVVEGVDHYEHYNQSEDQAYRIFCSMQVT